MRTVEVPSFGGASMREVDRIMTDQIGIVLMQMMENAGRDLARLAVRRLDNDVRDRPIVVLVGRGNKGGGGLVAARHLHNWGAWVQVVCTHAPDDYAGVPRQQLAILQAMGAPLAWAEEGWELPPCDLIVDAILGDGLRGEPRDRARDLILLAGSSHAPILSLDVPSGLDASSGHLHTPHIRAEATMALGLPKRGLLVEPGRSAAGDLYVADIGVPPVVYAQVGLEVPPLFEQDTVVPLDVRDGRAYLATSGR
jgi:NAD(P)H-hydrate epimerase